MEQIDCSLSGGELRFMLAPEIVELRGLHRQVAVSLEGDTAIVAPGVTSRLSSPGRKIGRRFLLRVRWRVVAVDVRHRPTPCEWWAEGGRLFIQLPWNDWRAPPPSRDPSEPPLPRVPENVEWPDYSEQNLIMRQR